MPQQLDRPGTFRAEITDYVLLAPFPSGAIAVKIVARITAEWDADLEDGGGWTDWSEYGVEADGLQWLIKKDGSLNQGTAENLIQHAGWDGDLDSLQNRTWAPRPCQVVCNEEKDPDRAQYNQFPVAFVNAYDAAPGANRQMAPEMVAQLKAQHGAGLRALAGNVTRNAPVPSGKPKSPPKPAKRGLTEEEAREAQKPDDIPF